MSRSKKPTFPPLPPELQLVRLELETNGFSVPKDLALTDAALLSELDSLLRPRTHERRIPPYGAVICGGEFGYAEAAKVATSPPLLDIRSAADGRRTFVVYQPNRQPQLWKLNEPCDTELRLLDLARAGHGLAVKRIESGLVSLTYAGWAYTVRNREWLVRRPITDMADAVAQVAPGAQKQARHLLALCCYVLSPKNLGTTFVYYLREPTAEDRTPWAGKPDIQSLGLGVDEPDDYSDIAHLVGHTDGASLVGPNGVLRSLGGHLGHDSKTAQLLSEFRGTRHTSAKFYSYEHPAAVVFVVSEDGEVSVFSDGARVGQSPVEVLGEAGFLRAVSPEPRHVQQDLGHTTCSRCGKMLVIQILTVLGWKEDESVACPVCGNPGVYSAMCWRLVAAPLKQL